MWEIFCMYSALIEVISGFTVITHTRKRKSANQNSASNKYSLLIGQFWSMYECENHTRKFYGHRDWST